MCKSRNPQRDEVAVLIVKTLIMINLCDRRYVICFIISSEVKYDILIYLYQKPNMYVEGLSALCKCSGCCVCVHM